MTWASWLGLGFAGGFAAAAYIFSKGVRSRVHAVIKGIIWGTRHEDPDEPPEPPLAEPKAISPKLRTAHRDLKRKCFVCPESSPQSQMIRATLGKQTGWIHPACQGKLTEVQSKFDYPKGD